MEKALEKGEDKIQKICDSLRRETLEPAKEEAKKIVEEAKEQAERIVADARSQAEKHHAATKEAIEQERQVFYSSLEQAAKQSLEELRQAIEKKLFNEELNAVLQKHTADPKVIASIITSMITAIEKEGISADLSAVIPDAASPEEINSLLGNGILSKLRENAVSLGEFAGGAQVKMHDKKMSLEMTDAALMELLSRYVRKDFRKFLFAT